MAGPLMVAGAIMAAGSTVMGAIQQGEAAQAAAFNSVQTGEYNATIAETNAKLALQEASIARALAKNRAIGKTQEGQKQIGAGRAVLGSMGVDILAEDSSPLDAFMQVASDYASAAELEIYNGEVEAIGKENQAAIYKSRAQQERWKGYADANAYLSQAPTVLGTVLKVGGTLAMTGGYMANEGMFKSWDAFTAFGKGSTPNVSSVGSVR